MTTTPEDRVETLNAAVKLTGVVAVLTQAVKALGIDQNKLRRLTRLLAISLILDLVLTVGIGFLSVNNHTLNQRLQQAQVNACVLSNQVRKDDTKRWDQVLKLITPPPSRETPQAERTIHGLYSIVKTTDKPLDCDNLSSKIPSN